MLFLFDKQRCAVFFVWGGMLKVGKPEKWGFECFFCEIGFQFAFKICLVSIKRREYLQSIPKNVSWYPKQLGLKWFKWMLGETTISQVKVWNYPFEATIA